MNYFKILILTCSLALPFGELYSQTACPSVNAGPDVTICGGCTNLNALVQGTSLTTSYSVSAIPYTPFPYNTGTPVLVGIDDEWSPIISLPFCFQFFNNTYNQCILGSNDVVSFDITQSNGYNTWPIAAAIPTNTVADMMNCIMGPWHDIDPSVSGNMYWQVTGTAPCRRLIVSWDLIPMFSCNNLIATAQTVLYETTNIIDVYIQDKPVCSTWNGGAAIEGIQDATGTTAFAVPGRNFPTVWTANNDAYRFTPSGAPQWTITWFDGNNNPIGNNVSINVCPSTTTTYVAQVVNQTCNGPITVTDSVKVIVSQGNLSVTTASTPSPCSSSSGTATATPNGNGPFTYSWAPGGQTTATATGLASGTYSVTVTDANGCQVMQTVVVGSSSGMTASVASFSDITCFGLNNGSGTVSPNGGTGPYNYAWTPSGGNTATATGLSAGIYTITITDVNGCTATTTITITEPPLLTIVISNSTNTSCGFNNGSATTTTTGGTVPYTYVWSPSGQTTANASNLAGGNYTVTVTDAHNCTATATVNIAPSVGVPCSFSGIDTVGCSPVCVTFTNTSLNALTCSWSFGDNTSSTLCNTTHCYTTPGTYDVSLVITTASGCTAIATHTGMVTVHPNPIAAFNANPPTASEYDPTISFTYTGTGATTFSWTFGDPANSSSTQQNPSFTYSATGNYQVTLYVQNSFGCRDSITQTVYVIPEMTFYAPNAFTPNGDGINEVFMPIGTNIEVGTYLLYIFDRWGNLIFKSNDLYKGWDGKANGGTNIAQEDVYVWKVVLNDLTGKKHKFVGHVSLVK